MSKSHYLTALLCFCLVGFVSCGLLNAALGSSGYAPQANTPEAQQKAKEVDTKIFEWWQWLLLGTVPLLGADNVRQRRRVRRATKAPS